MKAKIIIVVCVATIAGYLAYINLFMGTGEMEDKNVRASFKAFMLSVASKNKVALENLVASNFTDKKITRKDFVNILMLERETFSVNIQAVKTEGNLASIFYSRTESRGKDGDPFTVKLSGETWVRDKKEPAVWRLQKLAPNDKWFRSADIKLGKKKMVAAKGSKRVLGSLEETGAQFVSIKPGERYSPVGRRDPFRSLISFEFDIESGKAEVCDQDRPRDLLEGYDLPSLKLSGVIIGSASSMALIETPDGKGYTVRMGNHMGKRCGEIVEIESQYLIVKEQFRKVGVEGVRFEFVDTSLKLRPEEG